MASNLDIPQFGVGVTPGINASRMQAIWTFLKAIGSGGAGSVVKADDATTVAAVTPTATGKLALAAASGVAVGGLKAAGATLADNSTQVAATTPSAVGLSMLSAANKAAQQALVAGSGLDADTLDTKHLADLAAVSSEGLSAYWSMDSVPEIPDAPSPDTTYLKVNDISDTAGWSFYTGHSGAVVGGKLIVTSSGAGTSRFNGITTRSKTIRMFLTASVDMTLNFNDDITNIVKTFEAGRRTPVDLFFTNVTYDFFDIETSDAGTITIDTIYIGTGAYLPNSLIDNSGNGNHGTIYGATPVAGISGKALGFDGVNDYVVCPTSAVLRTELSAFVWITPSSISGVTRILHSYGSFPFTDGGWSLYNSDGALGIETLSQGESAGTTRTISSSLQSGESCLIGFTFNNGELKLYKNGIILGSFSQSITNLGVRSVVVLGSLLGSQFFSGTIDEPRIYNRALSAEEVYSLYHNKGNGPDCQVKSVKGIANSLVVRNASGYIEDAAPKPRSATTSDIGHVTTISAGDNAAASLPAGGTWDYTHLYVITATNIAIGDSMVRGVAAGGATPKPAVSGYKQTLMCWRIA